MKIKQAIIQKHKINSIIPLQASQVILKQIISQIGLQDPAQQLHLKKIFNKKYSQHLNLMHYNKLRQDKFIESQKKVLQKQHSSIEQARQYIESKQLRALQNKNKSITQRNKRIQLNIQKWKQKLQMTKEKAENGLQSSQKLINGWNQKLSNSYSRKSIRLDNISMSLKQRWSQKSKKIQQYQRQLMQNLLKNPQERSNIGQRLLNDNRSKASKKSIRISTQNIFDKKRRYQDDHIEKSLIKMISKESKINEARYLKQYLLKKKQSQLQQKQENIKRLRLNHLQEIKHHQLEKHKQLDDKFKNSRIKIKNKSSLPAIQIKSDRKIILNGPGEEWRIKKVLLNQDCKGLVETQRRMNRNETKGVKNYDKIIVEKLRDVSQWMRRKSHHQ